MDQFIIKRNGEYRPFEPFKIKDAIKKAFNSVSEKCDYRIYQKALSTVALKPVLSVEEIQDTIEKTMFDLGYFNVMKSFMLYRHTRKLQREHVNGLNDDTTYIDSTQTVEEYISGS
ncbi:MAG: Anaerobic ribonucleoside-triphosphate reductase, partial [Bacteroidota bacterium]